VLRHNELGLSTALQEGQRLTPRLLAVSLPWPELPISDDPTADELLLVDPQSPHRQPVLIPGQAVSFADRHELVERFENADRSGYVSVPNGAFLADVGEVSRHAAHSSKPRLTNSRLVRRSHAVQSHGSYHHSRGNASSAINARPAERANVDLVGSSRTMTPTVA
jgi:hypothetical protein